MLKELLAPNNYPYLVEDDTTFYKCFLLIKMYALVIAVNFACSPILAIAEGVVTNIFHYQSILGQSRYNMQQVFYKLGRPAAVLYICIIGPLFEEGVFRLGLSFKKSHVSVSIALICVLLFKYVPVTGSWPIGYKIGVPVAVFAAAYILMLKFVPDIRVTDKTRVRIITALQ